MNDKFQRTKVLLDQGSLVRAAIQAELDKPALDWIKLRRLIVNLRENDILFQKEAYRVELMCLDKIPNEDRISSLKREFGKSEPPQITVQERH